NRRARLRLFAQYPARQGRKRSLAVVTEQGLYQPGPRVSRAFGQSFFTDRWIAKPAVALPIECPVPTQTAWNGRRGRQWLALFSPLPLFSEPLARVGAICHIGEVR